MMELEDSAGYKSLLESVEKGNQRDTWHDGQAKMAWVIDRARHYSEKTGLPVAAILDEWEAKRTYWYQNYYQDGNQPKLDSDHVRVFETKADLLESVGAQSFRCPACRAVTTDAYECNSGAKNGGKVCDWKSYGLFGTMGKGAFVFVKASVTGQHIFMPTAWEADQ